MNDNENYEDITSDWTHDTVVKKNANIPQTKMLLSILRIASNEAYGHSIRVADTVRKMMALSGTHLSPQEQNDIITGALLHDIGKMFTPFNLSQYPGKLSFHEREIMRVHATLSYEVVKTTFNETIKNICLMHHMYDDGSGYPPKDEKEIPEYVKWVQVADIYDALISDRVYRPAFTREQALEQLQIDVKNNKIDHNAYQLLEACTTPIVTPA